MADKIIEVSRIPRREARLPIQRCPDILDQILRHPIFSLRGNFTAELPVQAIAGCRQQSAGEPQPVLRALAPVCRHELGGAYRREPDGIPQAQALLLCEFEINFLDRFVLADVGVVEEKPIDGVGPGSPLVFCSGRAPRSTVF